MLIDELKQARSTYQQQYEGMCQQRSFADLLCGVYFRRFKDQLPDHLDELAVLCRQFLKFYDMSVGLEKQTCDILSECRILDDLINGNK